MRRQLEALPFRILHRIGVDFSTLPKRFQPTPMRDIGLDRLLQPEVWHGVSAVAPSASKYLDDFALLWDSVIDVAIEAHSRFGGEYAGAGPIDFVEAFVLYALVRERRPTSVLELGFAAGISTWVLASAVKSNGNGGVVDTVDIKDNGDIIEPFKRLTAEGIIQPHFADARDFVRDVSGHGLTFSDALHTYDFNTTLASLLRERLPDAIHCYHEWCMAPHATRREAQFVSMRMNLGSCGERAAFEQTFPGREYRHVGIPSSCGIGVIIPVAGS